MPKNTFSWSRERPFNDQLNPSLACYELQFQRKNYEDNFVLTDLEYVKFKSNRDDENSGDFCEKNL